MSKSWLFLAALIVVSGAATAEEPAFPLPSYVLDGRASGLKVDGQRLVTESGQVLLAAVPKAFMGAAYYEDQRQLIVASRNGEVILYVEANGAFVQKEGFAPKVKAKLIRVLFTRIPGLVYALWIDVHHAHRIHVGRQEYPDRYQRVVLLDSAEPYDAMPVRENERPLLTGWFKRTGGTSVPFSVEVGKSGSIELAEPLGLSFRSGPYDPLAEAVFYFPDYGFVCRTDAGWSVNKLDGSLVKHFPIRDSRIRSGWWENPVRNADQFYAYNRIAAGGDHYLLDVNSGEMVKKKLR